MLIISRKKNQKIIVANEIEITILDVGRNRVRFGIKAPKHIPIQTRLKTLPDDQALDDESIMEGDIEDRGSREVALPAAVASFGRS